VPRARGRAADVEGLTPGKLVFCWRTYLSPCVPVPRTQMVKEGQFSQQNLIRQTSRSASFRRPRGTNETGLWDAGKSVPFDRPQEDAAVWLWGGAVAKGRGEVSEAGWVQGNQSRYASVAVGQNVPFGETWWSGPKQTDGRVRFIMGTGEVYSIT